MTARCAVRFAFSHRIPTNAEVYLRAAMQAFCTGRDDMALLVSRLPSGTYRVDTRYYTFEVTLQP